MKRVPQKDRDPGVKIFLTTLDKHINYLYAYSYFNDGKYKQAEKILEKIKEKDPEILYLKARTYEYNFKPEKAIKTYEEIKKLEAKQLAAKSEYAIKRIKGVKENLKPQKTPEAIYIGEDRITKGDWQNKYGKYFYILCGMAGYFDITGGEAKRKFVWLEREKDRRNVYIEKYGYDVYVDTPLDCARAWISKLEDPFPSFLFNPVKNKRMPANWDDHGEVYPVGKGPDLFFEFKIPEDGKFLLSLYFLNDPCYYEPSREYTIYIFDKGRNQILACCGVEDFHFGVYKKFIIPGNKQIKIRICRNLSLNTLLHGIFVDRI